MTAISNEKKTTIHDVAALAGVSIKTVSRVVNKESSIREETRERVLDAIKTLNYVPNPSARGLAGSHSFLLGLLYDNPSANYIIDVQDGALLSCRREGFDLLIHPCDHASPALADEILALRRSSRVGGLILTPPLSDMEPLCSALCRQGLPYVRIAPASPGIDSPSVFCDDRRAAREITEHLISLGHRDIGFIRGHPQHPVSDQRQDGYREALTAAGIVYREELLAQGHFDFESGRRCARQLLAGAARPSAIFASNDDMAAGVIFEAHEMGIGVPGQLSVTGFDDTPVARQIWPALTTVRQPIREMAERAAGLLIGLLRDPASVRKQEPLACSLRLRQSTGPRPT